jgi:prepilin-type N-terminal cleavage/methylation domain-containing protein
MKKGFSLLELTIVILLISILATIIIQKTSTSLEYTKKVKIKSEIALIRDSISKLNTSKILLNDNTVFLLDEAQTEEENSKLFEKVLDFPLFSTTSSKKELAKWIKISNNVYKIFFSSTESLEFSFEENSFICKSEISLCKEFE